MEHSLNLRQGGVIDFSCTHLGIDRRYFRRPLGCAALHASAPPTTDLGIEHAALVKSDQRHGGEHPLAADLADIFVVVASTDCADGGARDRSACN